jgi:hypothetical protein
VKNNTGEYDPIDGAVLSRKLMIGLLGKEQ